ncbi:MAG: hypothetical protein P8I83_01780 [Paracoccaceae bacterium]|jgi:hypothetical protein|nr:hypothetical protein [Paracoccaceae bacterium]
MVRRDRDENAESCLSVFILLTGLVSVLGFKQEFVFFAAVGRADALRSSYVALIFYTPVCVWSNFLADRQFLSVGLPLMILFTLREFLRQLRAPTV